MNHTLKPALYGYTHPFIKHLSNFKKIPKGIHFGIADDVYFFVPLKRKLVFVWSKEILNEPNHIEWMAPYSSDGMSIYALAWYQHVTRNNEPKPLTFANAVIHSASDDISRDYSIWIGTLRYLIHIVGCTGYDQKLVDMVGQLFGLIWDDASKLKYCSDRDIQELFLRTYQNKAGIVKWLKLPTRKELLKAMWTKHFKGFCDYNLFVKLLANNPHYDFDKCLIPVGDSREVNRRNIWLDYWASKTNQGFDSDNNLIFPFKFRTDHGYRVSEKIFMDKLSKLYQKHHPAIDWSTDENVGKFDVPDTINISPLEFYAEEFKQCKQDIIDFYRLDTTENAFVPTDKLIGEQGSELLHVSNLQGFRNTGNFCKNLLEHIQVNANTKESTFFGYRFANGNRNKFVLVGLARFFDDMYCFLDPTGLTNDDLMDIEDFENLSIYSPSRLDRSELSLAMITPVDDVEASSKAGYVKVVFDVETGDELNLTLDEFRELLQWQKLNEETLRHLFKGHVIGKHFNDPIFN